jgi:hypothetical protein
MITSATDPNYLNYPCIICPFPYYVFHYSVDPTSGIGRIVELFPVCKNEIQVFATSPQSSQVLPPGTPDSSIKWPQGIYDSFALAWTASPSSGKFWVATNTAGVDINSLALKSGNSLYYCVSGIAGPGCPVANFIPLNNVEEKNLGEFKVKITRDRGSWCASTVQYFDPRPTLYDGTPNPNYNQWVPLVPEPATVNDQALVNCGSTDGNQRCQECIIYGHSSPGCYTYSSGGTTYKVPTGCK